MSSSDAFALRRSGLNEFLFAPVGTEANGMTLSLVSVFARLGDDPWREAGRLARLPAADAITSLAGIIVAMPTSKWALPAATTIAARLVALLPTRSGAAGLGLPASADRAKAGRCFRIGLLVVFVAGLAAFEAGLFTSSPNPPQDSSDVNSFTTPPR
jgi:hypothetical protein